MVSGSVKWTLEPSTLNCIITLVVPASDSSMREPDRLIAKHSEQNSCPMSRLSAQGELTRSKHLKQNEPLQYILQEQSDMTDILREWSTISLLIYYLLVNHHRLFVHLLTLPMSHINFNSLYKRNPFFLCFQLLFLLFSFLCIASPYSLLIIFDSSLTEPMNSIKRAGNANLCHR